MHLLQKKYVENSYAASSWNYEKATKYIFEVGSQWVEASFFEHYDNTILKKKVIELPSSYGCPMKCVFCASSHIEAVQQLNSDIIFDIYQFIISDMGIPSDPDNLVISFTGMGDLFFTINEVEKTINKIAHNNSEVCFTVSSCCWTSQLLQRIERLAKAVVFRAVQFSFVSHDPLIIEKIIPFYRQSSFVPSDYIHLIKTSQLNNIRINYVMIKDINDSDSDFDAFIKLFSVIKDNITIRISKLNETVASNRNNLLPPDLERMYSFKNKLYENGFHSYLFYSAQNDNMNCGQLITEYKIT